MKIPLMVGWFFFAAFLNLPLMLTNAFGEDPSGFCGAKKFTSVPLLLSYEMSIIFMFAGSLIVTGIYYYRALKWLKQHHSQNIATNHKEIVAYTRGILRVMKIVTLLPLSTGKVKFIDGCDLTKQMIPYSLKHSNEHRILE